MNTVYGFNWQCVCVAINNNPVCSQEERLQITIETIRRYNVSFTCQGISVKLDGTYFHERKIWPSGSYLTSSNPFSK